MGFAPDGGRSAKRVWLARKQLRKAQVANAPSLTIMHDGFTCTVKRINDTLSTATIAAPMGLVVICSLEDSMALMIAENWTGSITAKQNLQILQEYSAPAFGFADGVKRDMSAYQTILFDSIWDGAYYKTVAGYIVADSYVEESPTPCPALLPYKQAEGFFCGAGSGLTAAYDLDIFEYLLHFYESDGGTLTDRTFTKIENREGTYYPWRVFMSLPATNFAVVYSQNADEYEIADSSRIAGAYLSLDSTGTMTRDFFKLTDIFSGIPAGLLAVISSTTTYSSANPVGAYAFTLAKDNYPVLLHACDLTGSFGTGGDATSTWFIDNPGNDEWHLFYVIKDSGVNSLVSSAQFMAILETINPGSSTDWEKALLAFEQLFPRPSPNARVPHDSAMFHAEDGNIYVYTRKYGMFQISKTGITTTSFIVPSEVATTGTRPSITYAGDGKYLCVCENLVPPRHVYAIYYGSPFVSWTALPTAEVGFHLEYIRPVKVSVNIVLLGIMKDETTSDHYVVHLNYTGTEVWNKLTKLPVTDAVRMNWDVCLFGKGAYVKDLSEYLDPPNIYYRMPVCSTYADYDQP